MIILLEFLLPVLGTALDALVKNNAPSTVLEALQKAIEALTAHKDDLITKAALEAARG